MAKISFKLSDQRLNTGGTPGQLSAPMLGGGSGSGRGIHAPEIRPVQADAATLPSRQKNVPLIDPQVLHRTAGIMIDATMRFNDRVAETEAEDALLRANSAAADFFLGVDSEGKSIGYGSKMGKEAVDSYGEYSSGIDTIYEQHLPAGDLARAKYLNKAMQYRERARNVGADHRVKQQEVYEGGQRYARAQQVLDDFQTYGEAIFHPGPDGLSQFERALQGYPTVEEADKVRSGMYADIVGSMLAKADDVDATAELGKLTVIKNFNDRYSVLNSPFKRGDVENAINSSMVAAQKRQKYEYKENMAKLRAADNAQAPVAMFSSLQQGDMKGVFNTLEGLKRGYQAGEEDQYETDAGQAMKEMVRTGFFVGKKNTVQLEEQINTLSRLATEQGTPLSSHLEYAAKSALEELKGTERASKARDQRVAYNTVLLSGYDEDGNFDIEKAKKAAESANLDTNSRVKLQNRFVIEQRRKTTADLKKATTLQDIQFAAVKLDLESDGTDGRSVEEFQEEMEAKVALGDLTEKQALNATSAFVKTMRREEREGLADPDMKLIRGEVKALSRAGAFTGKTSDKPENVLLNKQAAARLIRNAEAWRRANPKADLQGWWTDRQKEMQETTFFGNPDPMDFSKQGIPSFENRPVQQTNEQTELEKKAFPLPSKAIERMKANGTYDTYLKASPKQQEQFFNKYVKGKF